MNKSAARMKVDEREEAKEFLLSVQKHLNEDQVNRNEKITKAFSAFVDGPLGIPDEEDFAFHMEGVILTSRIFYHLLIKIEALEEQVNLLNQLRDDDSD